MVVNMKTRMIRIVYHMNEGQIYPLIHEIPKENPHLQPKLGDGDKKMHDTKEQREHKRAHDLEKECFNKMRDQERTASNEEDTKRKREDTINELRKNNTVDKGEHGILEKSLHDLAREKYKFASRKKEDDEEADKHSKDKLYPVLARLDLLDKQDNLNHNEAL